MTVFDDLLRKITLILAFFIFMSNSNCMHSGVEHEKFYNLGPWSCSSHAILQHEELT